MAGVIWSNLNSRLPGGLFLVCLATSTPFLRGQEGPQDRIQALFEKAQLHREAGERELVESELREAVGIALNQLGVIYTALDEEDFAEQALKQAAGTAITSVSSLLELSILYLRSGQYEKGKEVVAQILELNPLQAKARHVLGKIYFLLGDYQKAASELQDSYQVDRRDPSVAYTLGLTWLRLEQPDRAAAIFSELEQSLGESAQLSVLFGKAYRQANFADRAAECFQKAVDLEPNFPRGQEYLGLSLLLWKGREAFPEAIQAFKSELERNPASYYANFYLGLIYHSDRRFAEVIPLMKNAIESNSSSAEAFHYLGDSLYGSGDLTSAAQALRTAIELTPADDYSKSKTHYVLGRVLLDLGAKEEAEQHFRLASEFKKEMISVEADRMQDHLSGVVSRSSNESTSPGDIQKLSSDSLKPDETGRKILENAVTFYREAAATGLKELGRHFVEQDRIDLAVQMLERGFGWDPKIPELALNLAVARLHMQDLAGAVEPMVEAYRQNPASLEIRNNLANLALELVRKGDARRAEPAVLELLAKDPHVAQLNFLAGQIQLQQGKFIEALGYYDEVQRVSPTFPELAHFKGVALLRLGRTAEALEQFEAAAREAPSDPRPLYNTAVILVTEQRLEEAVPLLNRVISIDSNYSDAYYQLGKVQLDLGQTLLGTANLETATHLDPTRPYSFFQLARAYRLRGRVREAEAALEQYKKLKRLEEEAQLERRQPPTDGGLP